MDLKKTSKLIFGMSTKIVFWIVCLTIFIVICREAYSLGYKVYNDEAMAAEGKGTDIIITIPDNATHMEVAELLLEDELIENKFVYFVQALLYEAKYEPGEYTLSTEQNAAEMIEVLRPIEAE